MSEQEAYRADVSAAGVLGARKLRQLYDAGYRPIPADLLDELLETANDVLNGDADLSELDDLMAHLHREANRYVREGDPR